MRIPTNKITEKAKGGISVRQLTLTSLTNHTEGLHRDDYYMLCLLLRGELRLSVDFQDVVVRAGEIGCLLPGQVHQFIGGRDIEGYALLIDSVIISEEHRRMMQRFAFAMRTLPIDESRTEELSALFPMLLQRVDTPHAKNFVQPIVSIFSEVISESDFTSKLNPRHREVLMSFSELVDQHITQNRQPSFYADRLNITTGYLNEILTAAVGLSTSSYIGREIVLRMKRELAYSKDTVQEIARHLGFEDYAYFSRLFTKQVGISPTAFRSKYHV